MTEKREIRKPEIYKLNFDYAMEIPEEKKMSKEEDTEKLIRFIDDNIIGNDQTFVGPFGRRKVVYCDYAASARSLSFIEDYILKEVLPYYGNTNATTSVTSMQSTTFREEAREILRNATNASDDDIVLFTGNGCTGAIHKIIRALDFTSSPVVFVGPCEQHSNLSPWKQMGAKIIRISETKEGILDLTDLETKLAFYKNTGCSQMIGCFSAASNITGILADDIATTILLHQYGALAFWDYSTAAPCVTIDMNPIMPGINQKSAHKDAIFFSGHKFIGGVQSPGILVGKKSILSKSLTLDCGEASVSIARDGYIKDTESREEGRAAPIVESIRAGMVVKLKQAIGVSAIMEHQDRIVKTVLSFIRKIPEIILLGSSSQAVKRVAIFSVLVRHPRGAYLHHNFVCAVLNDMFGIQARGGCACAGPYAQDLMGIDKDLAHNFEEILTEERINSSCSKKDDHSCHEMLRPGFTRLSLPFFMSEEEIGYVLEALKMVATEGWKLLPQYILNPETGEWRHNSNITARERKSLNSIRYMDGKMTISERRISGVSPCPGSYSECLKTARSTFNKMAKRLPVADQGTIFNKQLNSLRWFMIPNEAQDLLLGHCQNVKQDVPFSPTTYSGSKPTNRITPILKRHSSLCTSDTEHATNRDIKILRQRSESNSPARNGYSKLSLLHSRERCHSLGSALLPELCPYKYSLPRQRLLSTGSQVDSSDIDGVTGDENQTNNQSLRYTPDLVYVEGITKELATEIKSELREVIAQCDDVLYESADSESYPLYSYEKRPTFDMHRMKRKAYSLPMPVANHPPQNYSGQIYGAVNPCYSLPTTISAERFNEYLVGFTSEVVSEMKSEFRGVVDAVEELICPAVDLKQKNEADNLKPIEKPCLNKLLSQNEKIDGCKNLQSSHDSGINMNERDLSPTEGLKANYNGILQNECEKKMYDLSILEKQLDNITEKNKSTRKKSPSPSLSLGKSTPKTGWCPPTREIWKPASEAIQEFDMIREGDKVLVCLSGGKDSLTLLHVLHQYQYYAAAKGVHFELGAATVDLCCDSYNPRPLISYIESLGINYHYEEQRIIEQAAKVGCKSLCSFCSRLKRGKLYATARKYGYNVLALGQHLDDISESLLMSAFHNGHIQTMKAHYTVKERDLRVIRPLSYVRECTLKYFAETRNLPVVADGSLERFQPPKERLRMKQLLAKQESIFPKLFLSLKSAIKPVIRYNYFGQERTV